LHANGSEVLSNADRLYTDIDTSLFSEAGDLINSWEKATSSFYAGLVRQVDVIQRYLFPNDTELEQFLRRLSVWRMPVVNFQKSQVLLLFIARRICNALCICIARYAPRLEASHVYRNCGIDRAGFQQPSSAYHKTLF